VSANPARAAALRVLGRVRRSGAWVASALDADPSVGRLEPRDRAFVTALTRGVVSHAGTLDAFIDEAASRPSAIEPRVRDALRLAAYEILYLATPSRAAVNEGVNLVRSIQPRAASLSNAVLRRISERAQTAPFGDTETSLEALALATGHPAWMAHLLAEDLGEQRAREFMSADETQAPLYLAHNPFSAVSYEELLSELAAQGCEPAHGPVEGSLVCGDAARTVTSPALKEGRAIVCDLCAQAIVAAVPIISGSVVFESAAGRGTKTLLLQAAAVRAGGAARIVAGDVHGFKVDLLTARMHHLGVPGVTGVAVDSCDDQAVLALTQGRPDVVFVDAPCSGLGTMRRHPEKRWSLSAEDIVALASISEELLGAALRLVRPGGFVVYSTCTVTRRENAQVVEGAVRAASGTYEMVSLAGRIAPELSEWVTGEGYFQSLPREGGPDGHFAALVARVS